MVKERVVEGLTGCVHGRVIAAACDVCGEHCVHGIKTAECMPCWERVRWLPQRVWVTAGGERFHADRDCEWLDRGQTDAALRDLPTYRKHEWPSSRAVRHGRWPCRGCLSTRARRIPA